MFSPLESSYRRFFSEPKFFQAVVKPGHCVITTHPSRRRLARANSGPLMPGESAVRAAAYFDGFTKNRRSDYTIPLPAATAKKCFQIFPATIAGMATKAPDVLSRKPHRYFYNCVSVRPAHHSLLASARSVCDETKMKADREATNHRHSTNDDR